MESRRWALVILFAMQQTKAPLNGCCKKPYSHGFKVIIILNAIAEKNIPKQRTKKDAGQGNQTFHTTI